MGGDHHHASAEAAFDVAKAQPSEALTHLLKQAQADHRKCVEGAMKHGHDVVDKCAYTWGEVHLRWMQFSGYRAPFKNDASETKYSQFWTKARIHYDDTKLF